MNRRSLLKGILVGFPALLASRKLGKQSADVPQPMVSGASSNFGRSQFGEVEFGSDSGQTDPFTVDLKTWEATGWLKNEIRNELGYRSLTPYESNLRWVMREYYSDPENYRRSLVLPDGVQVIRHWTDRGGEG